MNSFLRIAVLFLLACIVYSCHTPTASSKEPGEQKAGDSAKVATTVQDTADPTPSVADIISEFRDSVQRETLLDTTRIIGGDTLHLTIRQQKVENGSFLLPRRYLEDVLLDSFRAWNMSSDVRLFVNSRLVLKMNVEKQDFFSLADESLRRYGVLMFPEVEKIDKNTVKVSYSLTIPLTDVGIGVFAQDVDGVISYGSGEAE